MKIRILLILLILSLPIFYFATWDTPGNWGISHKRVKIDSFLIIGTNTIASYGDLPVTAKLTILGGSIFANSSTGEHRLVNSKTTGSSGYAANVLSLLHTRNTGSCAIRALDVDSNEMFATGYQNGLKVGSSFFLTHYAFLAGTSLTPAGTYISGRYPPGVCLAQQGYNGVVDGKEVRRVDIDSFWNIKFRDRNDIVSLLLPAVGGLTFQNTSGGAVLIIPATGTQVGINTTPAAGTTLDIGGSAQRIKFHTNNANGAMQVTAGEQLLQHFKNATPTTAWSLGSNTVGSGAGDDFVVNMYSGAWNTRFRIKNNGIVNINNTPEYADNAAALVGGLVLGDVYRTGDALKIVH